MSAANSRNDIVVHLDDEARWYSSPLMATTMAFPSRGASHPSTPSSLSRRHHRHHRSRPGMRQILPGLAVILVSQQTLVEAACSKINFLFPTPTKDPPEYNAEDTLVTSYQSNVETQKIILMCTTGGNSASLRKLNSYNANSFNNSFQYQLPASAIPDGSSRERCWFILHPQNQQDCSENDVTLRSPEFIVVPRTTRAPSTIGLKADPANPASSNTNGSNSDEGSGMTVGAQIGIGVGVSIIVGLLVGGLVVYFYLRRQQRNSDDPSQQPRGWYFPKIVWQRSGSTEKPGSDNPRPLLNRKDSARTDSANFSDSTRPSAVSNFSSYSPPSPQGPVQHDDSFFVGYSENLPGFYGSARGSGTKTDALGPSMYDTDARPAYQPGSYSAYHDPPKQQFSQQHQHQQQYIPQQHIPQHVPQFVPGEGMNKNDPTRNNIPTVSTNEYTVTPIEYYPPDKGTSDSAPAATFQPSAAMARPPSSLCEPDAELPGKESYRGYGQEFELPTQQRPQMYMPGGSAAPGVAGPGPGAAAAMARREAQEQKFLLEDVELMGLKKKKELRPPEERNPDEYL